MTEPTRRKPTTLLIAEDDADYRLLTRRAVKASRLATDLRFVEELDKSGYIDSLQ